MSNYRFKLQMYTWYGIHLNDLELNNYMIWIDSSTYIYIYVVQYLFAYNIYLN